MDIVVTTSITPTFTQLGPLCQNAVAPPLPSSSTNGITGTWNPAVISTTAAGTITYTFTPDAGQCGTTTTMDITTTPALNASTNVTNASAPGASDGAVNLTVTGGTAPYTFAWSNAATTEDISGLSAGTYNVTITDANGCSTTASATVTENTSPINASTAVTNASCAGAADGAVNLTVTGGTAPYTFVWSNAATTEDISGLTAGNYTVTVTDAAGVTASASATVIEPPALNASTNVTNASAPGASDGAVNLTVTGGTAPYTFAWSNAATTEDISGLSAGTYNVTITDANGCSTTASATVTENTSPINASTAVTNASCAGAADGAVNLTVTGGTAPYTFVWSNAATTEDISGLTAGNYTVTVTDAAGVTASASATVIEPPALNASTNVTNASAPGASDGAVNLTVTGGTAPYTFAWSNAATTEDISGLSAGTYNVTITDANGCSTTASATVTENTSPINASTAVTNASCAGAADGAVNLTVTGGTAPYTFVWSNAATTEDISGLTAGNYTVTITDAAGVTASASATVIEPPALNASTNVTNASAPGASDGAVNLTVTGGTAPYTFAWSNAATTEDISGLSAGTYNVTITDANGCSTTASATVTENTSPINASTAVTNASCAGAADGAVNLTVTGGTAPYTFVWSNAATTEDISGLTAGNYTVTVTDAAGVTASASATVIEPPALNASTNVTNASAPGASDGAVNLTVTGGTAPYTFAWSNAATTEDISGLSAGTYNVTITDANGCSTTASATVTENTSPINASTAVTNASCAGAADGAVNLTVTGGTAPYTFVWSNAATTEDISGLTAGNYTVTVTDAAGVTASASATVIEPPALNASTNVTNASAPGASDGAVNLTVTGGTAPYTFAWSNAATTEDISGLSAGTYNVTITDVNGCSTTASATVTENTSPINASTAVTNASCAGAADGAVNLTVTGGTAPYTFVWSNAATTEDISGLTAGNYTVTVTDAAGVTASASATVIEPPALNASTNVTNASAPGASDGAVNLTVTGGTAPYTFAWSNAATTEDISGLSAGTYNVTITDANGCSTTASATVTENASASLSVTKTVDQTNISAPVTLNYTITIVNTGSVGLTGVIVSDPFAGSAAYSSGDTDGDNVLDVSETWIYTADYTATQADINSLVDLVNTVSVRSTEVTTPVTARATTTISSSASLAVTKSVDQANISAPVTLNYTITITNTGSVGLTGVTVSDPFAGGAAYSSGDADGDNVLDVSEVWTYTADYTATQADINAGVDLVNTVSVRSTEVSTPVTARAVTTITNQNHGLSITKTATETSYSTVGEVIHFTIVVRNTGTVTLTDIIITDPLTNFNLLISSLAPGASRTMNTTYTIDQGDINAGEVLNRAIAAYTFGGQDYFESDDVTVSGYQGPELTVTKTATPGTYSNSGQTINYRVIGTNTGNVTLTNVVVIDPLTGLNQTIPSLAPGATITYNNTYSIVQNDLNRGYVDNTASVTFNYGGTLYFREASARITADLNPGIDISKRAQETNYSSVGSTINYTIVVTNTGNVLLSNILVTDPLTGLNRTLPSLAPGASTPITTSYTVTQNDINNGSIDNTARASTNYSGTSYSDQSSVSVPARQVPEIRIVKSSGETTFTTAGDIIHYSLTVTNSGNVTLTDVMVTDPDAAVTCSGSPFTLAPGATIICTAIHSVTAADINARSIRNVATVSGTDPGNAQITATSNEITVSLNNLAPEITCPQSIVTGTSTSTCDILINTGLNAGYSDPNNNIESLTWVMTGSTIASSPATGINDLDSYTFNLGVTTVNYTVTDDFGLSANCSFNVTVNDNTDPVAVCSNIDVYLDLDAGTSTITESDVNNGSTDNCGIASMSIDVREFDCTNIGPNNVVLTVTDNSGNIGTCTSVVTVHYADNLVAGVTPAADIICDGETTSLTLSSNVPAISWTWSVTSAPEISGASGDNSGLLSSIRQTLNNSDAGAHNVIYNIKPEVYGMCELPDISAEIWVNPTPQVIVSSSESVICYGESTTISVSNPNTILQGQWLYNLTVTADAEISGNTSGGTYTSPTNLTETLTNSGTEKHQVVYMFTPRISPDDGGPDCIGQPQIVTVWVHPRVHYTTEISVYNGFNITCYGKANGYIRVSPTRELAPYIFDWTGPDGFIASTEDISGLVAGEYTLSLTDVNNCVTSETFVLTEPKQLSMTIIPSVSTDGAFNISCAGASTGSIAVAALNNVGSADYLWIDGAMGSTRTNLSAGNYKVIITDSNNCQADSSFTLTEPEKIKLTFEIIDTFCPDSPDGAVTVDASGGVPGTEYNYVWSDNSTGTDISNIPSGRYSVTVTDLNHCSVKDSAMVRYLHDICLLIPDAFSPNRDLINDTWIIGNIEFYPDVEITIYNRWGQMVWESERGYPSQWDGRSKGIDLPVDAYHFVIDLHNGKKLFVGDVTIVR